MSKKWAVKVIQQNSGIKMLVGAIAMQEYGGAWAAHSANALYSNPENDLWKREECIVFNPTRLCVDFDNAEFIMILFHELGHATGRYNRLDRTYFSMNPILRTMREYAMEELTAERTAQKLMDHFGLDSGVHRAFSQKYIEHFSKDLSEEELRLAEMDADLAFSYILQNWYQNEIKIAA